MIRKMFTIASLVAACGVHAMEKVSVEIITTLEQLQEGINLSSKMFDEVFEKSPLEIEGQARYSKEHRAIRLQQLLSKQNRHDAFFKQGEEKIGFVATHADETKPGRVILDKGFLGKPENRKIVGSAMLQFIKSNYPEAQTVWCATPKQNAGSDKLVVPAGYTKSEFMDDLHDGQFCQGWERSLSE